MSTNDTKILKCSTTKCSSSHFLFLIDLVLFNTMKCKYFKHAIKKVLSFNTFDNLSEYYSANEEKMSMRDAMAVCSRFYQREPASQTNMFKVQKLESFIRREGSNEEFVFLWIRVASWEM